MDNKKLDSIITKVVEKVGKTYEMAISNDLKITTQMAKKLLDGRKSKEEVFIETCGNMAEDQDNYQHYHEIAQLDLKVNREEYEAKYFHYVQEKLEELVNVVLPIQELFEQTTLDVRFVWKTEHELFSIDQVTTDENGSVTNIEKPLVDAAEFLFGKDSGKLFEEFATGTGKTLLLDGDIKNSFISLLEEVNDGTRNFNKLVFFLQMPLDEIIDVWEKKKSVLYNVGSVGFFDSINGSGSKLSISLPEPVELDTENCDFELDITIPFCCSISDVYGYGAIDAYIDYELKDID